MPSANWAPACKQGTLLPGMLLPNRRGCKSHGEHPPFITTNTRLLSLTLAVYLLTPAFYFNFANTRLIFFEVAASPKRRGVECAPCTPGQTSNEAGPSSFLQAQTAFICPEAASPKRRGAESAPWRAPAFTSALLIRARLMRPLPTRAFATQEPGRNPTGAPQSPPRAPGCPCERAKFPNAATLGL